MSKYVIEIENIKKGVTVVTAGHVVWSEMFTAQGAPFKVATMAGTEAQGPLVMAPGDDEKPSVTTLTAAQFEAYAYDIACFSGGLKGCPKTLKLYVRDLETGVREQVAADVVSDLIASGLSADEYAAREQAKAQAELEAKAEAARAAEAMGEGSQPEA